MAELELKQGLAAVPCPVNEEGREVLLSIKNIDITFGKGDNAVRAVTDASFDIYRGETFSLVGESGSGKTTIGRAVIRVNPLSKGEILYKGTRISGRISHALDREVIRNVQMVFQDPAASLNERATVDYIISEGLYNFHLFKNEADRVQKVEGMINAVGLLPEHLTRYPHEFSGGQRQRIGIARAMVMEPELVVADEPISALDVSVRAQVLNLMKKFQQEKHLTYLFIAHDLSVVRFISDRIGVIYKGRIVEVAESEELFNFPLHPYTHSLISAIPIPDPKLEKNKVLYTYDPSIHDYSEDKPEFVCIGHGHWVYGNKKEIEQYKAIRDTGVPVKPITIRNPNAPEDEDGQAHSAQDTDKTWYTVAPVKPAAARKTKAPAAGSAPEKRKQEDRAASVKADDLLIRPAHDTGSIWYTILSFILPILGLIAMAVFNHFHHYLNGKACRKGAVAGLILCAAILVIFLLLIVLAVV